jgi:hypothetical protein
LVLDLIRYCGSPTLVKTGPNHKGVLNQLER